MSHFDDERHKKVPFFLSFFLLLLFIPFPSAILVGGGLVAVALLLGNDSEIVKSEMKIVK